MSCSSKYGTRYAPLFDEIKRDCDELATTGSISAAVSLSKATGQHFNSTVLPGYFGGDLDSDVVLVHLNPKQVDERVGYVDIGTDIDSVDKLIEAAIHGGSRMYGPDAPRTHRSPFDHKQVRFLRAMGALPFVDERTPEDRYTNLAMVLDAKLQMELVPYGSPDFQTSTFPLESLRPHFDRILRVIASAPRRYVLFCGRAFEPLVRRFIVETHVFRLQKNDGTPERSESRFSTLEIPYEGEQITAGLATSWARQGIPMRAYGERVRDLYGA